MSVFMSKNAKHQKYEREAHFYRTDMPKSSVKALETLELMEEQPSKFELPGASTENSKIRSRTYHRHFK